MQDIIKGASFVIVPSEWYENNPMAIIESYSLGKPVIAARIGAYLKFFLDGHTGMQFLSGDVEDLRLKIRNANNLSQDEYESMSMNAVTYASLHFDADGHYRQLMNLYEVLVNQNQFN